MLIKSDEREIVYLTEYGLDRVSKSSDNFAEGMRKMSTHEYNAAAIVNGRLDEIADYRKAFINMGREWAHIVIEMIFIHHELELAYPYQDPNCPHDEQCIFYRRDKHPS